MEGMENVELDALRASGVVIPDPKRECLRCHHEACALMRRELLGRGSSRLVNVHHYTVTSGGLTLTEKSSS